MARRKTIFEPGNYYHIYNRGANKHPIILEDKNYLYLIQLLKKYTKHFQLTVIAYCIMPNHFHFLLRQEADCSIADCMQRIQNTYTKAINKKYNRSGSLFEGPFKSILVREDQYLIHLCRYIHRNPLDCKPSLILNLMDWQYSNYLEWIGKRNGSMIDRKFVSECFSKNEYIDFVKLLPGAKVLNCIKSYQID